MAGAEREQAYLPSRWAHAPQATLARQAELGVRLRERHPPQPLRYGAGAGEGINLFVPPSGQPRGLMVFLHGGYWQELDASATDFLAESWLAAGWAFASVDYPLAPGASIEAMVEAVRRAVTRLQDALSARYPGIRVHLGGHSAGAHLALMSCLGEPRLTAIDSLWLISGIYDLRPLVDTCINAPLGLDHGRAAQLSPLCRSLQGLPPLRLLCGEHDPPAFRAQSECLERHARAVGLPCRLRLRDGCDHFDILERLADEPHHLPPAIPTTGPSCPASGGVA